MSRLLGVHQPTMPHGSSTGAPHSPAAATNTWVARSLSSPQHNHQKVSQTNVSRIEYFYDTHDPLTPMPPWTKRDVQLFGPLPPALTERERLIAARWLFNADTMEWTRPTPFDDPEGILLGRARELGWPVDGLEGEPKQNQQQQSNQRIQFRENQVQHRQQGLKRQHDVEDEELHDTHQQSPRQQQYTHPDQVPPSMRRAWEQYQLTRATQRMQAPDPNALQIKLIATPPPSGSPMMTTPRIKSASSPLIATMSSGSPLINHSTYPVPVTMSSPLRRPTYTAYPQRVPGHPQAVQLPHLNHVSMTPPISLAQPQPHHATHYQEQAILSQSRMRTPSSSLDIKPVISALDVKPVVSSPNAENSSPATTMSSARSTPTMQGMQPKQEEVDVMAMPAEGPARKKRRVAEASAGLMAVPTYVQPNGFIHSPQQMVYMHAQVQAQAHVVAYGGASSVPAGYYLPS